ncbi:gamma-glutamylcyclotransferase family protein [Bacillus sp. FJAT-45350]|uniref:gamma-glutamylcyclotransferase family protein n=1 Tax=Bacillus sp. FJAT-45350 TaxID=2011014 RepID=UPI000BB83815|nr:gamma-glutamylcyclotransferase family protein [Bacillus sp. FJAT-45350]
MKNRNRVFVYGTLRQQEANHRLLKEARCISRQCWTNGILYDTGNGYAAMLPSPSQKVYGELYEVTDHFSKARYEWFSHSKRATCEPLPLLESSRLDFFSGLS